MNVIWTNEKIARVWSYYAQSSIASHLYFGAHSGMDALRFINRRAPLAYRRVLDFGCGPGYMLEHLMQWPAEVVGVEFSADARTLAHTRIQKMRCAKGIYGGVYANVESIADESVDVVICCEVFEHLFDEQRDEALRQMRRVLKVGGLAVITVPNDEDLSLYQRICPECSATFHTWQHMQTFSAERLRAVVGTTFVVQSCEPVTFGLDRLGRLRRAISRVLGRQVVEPKLIAIGVKA